MPFQLEALFHACNASALEPVAETRCAAVALIFVDGANGAELCFVKRKDYPGDPWSGQMALPGGKKNVEDATPHDIASREAWEEVGVQLHDASLVGMMPRMSAGAGGIREPLPVYPVLYRLHSVGPPLTIGDELAEGHWISLQHLWDRENWASMQWRGGDFAGIHHGERVIWGFTLSVLTRLADFAEAPINDVYNYA